MRLATSRATAFSNDAANRTHFRIHDVALDTLHELYFREPNVHVPRTYASASNPRVVVGLRVVEALGGLLAEVKYFPVVLVQVEELVFSLVSPAYIHFLELFTVM